jgi:hypothetical protein
VAPICPTLNIALGSVIAMFAFTVRILGILSPVIFNYKKTVAKIDILATA